VDYRHNPFIINRYSFTLGGPNDLYQIDFINDRKQGFSVPAKSLVVVNIGGGVAGDYLHLQYAEKKQHFSPEISLYEGERLIVKPDDGVIISYMILWSDSANLAFSLVATPGIWTWQELVNLGYIKTKEGTIDEGINEVTF
jgi:hypothetical protein